MPALQTNGWPCFQDRAGIVLQLPFRWSLGDKDQNVRAFRKGLDKKATPRKTTVNQLRRSTGGSAQPVELRLSPWMPVLAHAGVGVGGACDLPGSCWLQTHSSSSCGPPRLVRAAPCVGARLHVVGQGAGSAAVMWCFLSVFRAVRRRMMHRRWPLIGAKCSRGSLRLCRDFANEGP